MHPELTEAVEFHEAIVAEAGKALVGYEREKALANIVLMSEIPTTYDKDEQRQVNAGNLLLRGVPGIGKTFFGVIIAAISDAKFARIQGRADLQPTEVVGFQMINPATGAFITEFGPLASAEVILLDEINRIPLKSQSAFLEGLQDRKITVGKTTYDLPDVQLRDRDDEPGRAGTGHVPVVRSGDRRFAIMVNIGYLPPDEEQKLVNFDFKQVHLNSLMSKERIVHLRGAITREVFLHEKLGKYIRRLVGATRPFNDETDWHHRSPSEMVEQHVDLGASPRATICWGRLVKVWALLVHKRDEVYPEDVQDLAKYVPGPPHLAGAARDEPRHHRRAGHRGHHREGADSVNLRLRSGQDVQPAELVNFAEITEIELRVLRRMKEYTLGDHGSVFHGTGVDFVGLRDWQAGDRISAIDWPQSSLTNFTPDRGARLRTARHRADCRRRRSLAIHPLRRGGRSDRRGHRTRDGNHRPFGRVLPGHVRHDHVRPGVCRHVGGSPESRARATSFIASTRIRAASAWRK